MVLFIAGAQPLASSPASWRSCGVRVWKQSAHAQPCVVGALGPGVPHIISTKLLKHFTCLTYNNGRSGGLASGALPIEEEAGRGGQESGDECMDWIPRPQTLLRRAFTALCRGLGSDQLRKHCVLRAVSPLERFTVEAQGKSCSWRLLSKGSKEPFLVSHRTNVLWKGSGAEKGNTVSLR